MLELEPQQNTKLWIPGNDDSLHDHYPVATSDELLLEWKSYNPLSNPEPSPGIYGVVERIGIERAVDMPALISIDLCEVMRNTADAVMGIAGKSIHEMDSVSSYGPAIGAEQDDVVSIVQVLMNKDLVGPIDDDKEIRKIIQSWRNIGVLCLANTSTLPGCELSTIGFMRKHYRGCFDGMLLPRNHDGTGPVSKGMAARFVIEEYLGSKELLAIHIDDAPHHNAGFVEAMDGLKNVVSETYMPGYKGNDVKIDRNTRTSSSLESFVLANDSLRNWRLENV